MRRTALLIFCGALALSGQEPWNASQVLRPAYLANQLGTSQPKIVNVGFAVLYKSKHIPGSVYAGPGSKEAGLEELKRAVVDVPKDREIVLYCGCCPWDHCPNMKPAFKLLQSLGYQQVKVVEIPETFSKDLVDKGYPVAGTTAH